MRIRSALAVLLSLAALGAHAASSPGPAARSASKATVVGTKIAAKLNPHPDLDGACVARIPDEALAPTVQGLFERQLRAEHLRAADTFFASPAGKATTSSGIDMLYASLAPQLGHTPGRELTPTEQAQAQAFMDSSAGRAVGKLMSDKGRMKEALMSRMHVLLDQCRLTR